MADTITIQRRITTTAGMFVLAAALAGCSSVGGMFGSSSSSSSSDPLAAGSPAPAGTGGQATATPPDFECPSIDVRSGASTLTINAAGKVNDATALELRYQGSIVRTARECSLSAGIVNLKVGIEGRVVLGPAGAPGQMDVPIRVAVVEEGVNPKTVVTKLYRTTVVIPPDQGNASFTYVAEDLSFPLPKGSEIDKYVIYLGFDPQPEPKARPAAPRRKRSAS